MNAMNLDQVANFLAEHPSRIQNWVSRNQFRAAMNFGRGGKRLWTADEVLRLAIFAKLVNELAISPSSAGEMTILPIHASEREDFFVGARAIDDAVSGLSVYRIPRSSIGDFFNGEYVDRSGRAMKDWGDALLPCVAIVIDPAPIVRAMRAEWDRLELDWE